MAQHSYGKRVIAAVMPRKWKTLTAIQMATGIAFSTIHDWSTGKSDPTLEKLDMVARASGIPIAELLALDGAKGARLRDREDWADALADARKRYAKTSLPDYAYEAAGETSGARAPERLDAAFVFDLAEFWRKHTTDEELIREETQAARGELSAARKRPRKSNA